MSELDPLDTELRALWALEGGAYSEDTSARDAVLRRIQAAIVLAPLAAGVAGSAAAAVSGASAAAGAAGAKANLALALGWKGAALVAVLAFGGGVAVSEARYGRSKPAVSADPKPAAPTSQERTVAPVLPPAPSLPEPFATSIPEVVPAGAASTPHATAAPPSVSDVNEERALIDTARSALARGLAEGALAATEQHASRFPRGRLAEEREALAVQALSLAGDRTAAEARATRFRRSFPSSIFRSAVDRAVAPSAAKKDAPP